MLCIHVSKSSVMNKNIKFFFFIDAFCLENLQTVALCFMFGEPANFVTL